MSAPGNAPITIYRHLDYRETWDFIDQATGQPIDVSGRTYTAELRYDVESTAADATFTCSVGGVDNNEVEVTLSKTAATALDQTKSAQWMLVETTVDGSFPILGGPVTIVSSATVPV